jgi:hypothetical protein
VIGPGGTAERMQTRSIGNGKTSALLGKRLGADAVLSGRVDESVNEENI